MLSAWSENICGLRMACSTPKRRRALFWNSCANLGLQLCVPCNLPGVLSSVDVSNTKNNEIFQRSPPRSADNGDQSSAARTQSAPVAQTRFPPSSHFMRETIGSCSISHTQTSPGQCFGSRITKHNGTAPDFFQRSPPRSADNGDYSSAARTQSAPVAQTRFPPSTPGATLCEKTHFFMWFQSPRHHPDKALEAAMSMQNASLDHQTH